MIEEEWKPVIGFEGRYDISNLGRVKICKRSGIRSDGHRYVVHERIMKYSTFRGNPYYYVVLSDSDKLQHLCTVHRLVAVHFVPNPYNLPMVNHKDENPRNNYYYNLEWCTSEYNNTYGTVTQRISQTLKFRKLRNV